MFANPAIFHKGVEAKLECALALLTGIMAVVLLFEKFGSSVWWKSFIKRVEDYDFGYLVFGLGLMTGGITLGFPSA